MNCTSFPKYLHNMKNLVINTYVTSEVAQSLSCFIYHMERDFVVHQYSVESIGFEVKVETNSVSPIEMSLFHGNQSLFFRSAICVTCSGLVDHV